MGLLLSQIAPKTGPFGSVRYDLLEMVHHKKTERLVLVSFSREGEYHNCPSYEIEMNSRASELKQASVDSWAITLN